MTTATPVETTEPDPRRWFALVVIAIAQLMVILDASIVNIALPSAAGALHIARSNITWVITAYTLAFGGLLLLGGRIADYSGRKRVFIIGLIGFAGASALGGFAGLGFVGGVKWGQFMLFSARALQGAFAAVLAPAALSLISTTFSDSKERAKAFGVYGALSGAGAAIGLLAGGFLTQYFSWRWCLFVNIPMALIAVVLAIPNVRESKIEGTTKYDIPGALLSTFGFVSIVFGITKASTTGWTSTTTITFLVAGVVLLGMFLFVEAKVSNPLLPMHILTDRIRAGSFLAQFLLAAGLFGMFLFMTYYFQGVLHYSAIKAGLAFLPFSMGIIVSAGVASQLLPKVGPRPLGTIGLIMGSGGLFYLSQITATSSYASSVLPAMLLMSLGLGMVFVTVSSTALFNVAYYESGVASAVLNTTQQIGGSLGTALFNTIAISASSAYVVANHMMHPDAASATHGYTVAFKWGAGSLLLGAIVFFFFVNIDKHHLAQHDDVVAPAL